jgi:hypothetical protein
MKLVKRLVLLVVVLCVLVVGAAVAGLFYINDLVKVGVEKGGTYAMGVKTTLGSADIGVFSGKAALSDLKVANPVGFKAEQFLGLGSGAVQVSLQSLREPVVEIPKLEMNVIRVSLEKKDGKTNYKVILDNLAKLSGKAGDGGGSSPSGGEEKKFIVRDLQIRDVRVSVDMLDAGLPVGAIVVPIDRIELKDIGTQSKGLPLADVAGIVVRAILATAAENGQGIIPTDILGDLQGQLSALGSLSDLGVKLESHVGKELEKAAQQAQDAVKKGVEDAAKGVEEGLKKGVEDGLKGIFGGDKNK